MIYKIILIFHLIGFMLVAGSIVFSFLGFRKVLRSKHPASNDEFKNINSYRNLVFGIGMALQILSGIILIVIVNGYTTQVWFKVKVVCILLLIINSIVFGSPIFRKFNSDRIENTLALYHRLRFFYLLQFFILAAIITVSIFKFD